MPLPGWEPDVGGNTNYDTCMPNCTVNVGGQARTMGLPCPSGFGGNHDFTQDGGSVVSASTARPGDIVRYNGSIAIVIGGYGSTALCSHSLYTTVSGTSHNYDGSMNRYSTDATGTTKESVGNYCNARGPERCHYTHNINSPGYGLGSPLVVFRSGTAPEPQPDPPPSADGYGDDNGTGEETETILVPYIIPFLDEYYECGSGTFGEQSGTQDEPRAPDHISSSSERLNQRGEPFNMYTRERRLAYLEDKSPIGSSWEEKYSGSDSFLLGQQPQYGNGGEMEGDDERE